MMAALSAKEVALRQLKRKNNATGTPSQDATPRTLIQGLLDAASINQSAVQVAKKRPTMTKSPTVPPPQKRRSLRKSIGDNSTPRTLIRNFLIEASPETPLEIPHETMLEVSPEGERDQSQNDALSQVKEANSTLPRTEEVNENVEIQENEQFIQAESEEHEVSDQAMSTEADSSPEKTEIFTAHLTPESPVPTNNKQDQALPTEAHSSPEISTAHLTPESPVPTNNKQDQAMSTETETSSENTEISTTHLTPDSSIPTNDEQDMGEGTIQDAFSMATHSLTNQWNKSKWKDLVTPHLPVTTRKVLHETNQLVANTEYSRTKRPTATKKKKPSNRAVAPRRQSSASTNLPSSLVKSIFQHFSKSRVTKETLEMIQRGSSLFFKQLSADLMAYCQHAGRTTIEIRDVELLMKRQGFVTSKQSLNSLIEKYLPMEYRQELIPVAQSGNKIFKK